MEFSTPCKYYDYCVCRAPSLSQRSTSGTQTESDVGIKSIFVPSSSLVKLIVSWMRAVRRRAQLISMCSMVREESTGMRLFESIPLRIFLNLLASDALNVIVFYSVSSSSIHYVSFSLFSTFTFVFIVSQIAQTINTLKIIKLQYLSIIAHPCGRFHEAVVISSCMLP